LSRRKVEQRALTRLDPNFGPGMFDSEEIIASVQRTQSDVMIFFRRRGKDWLKSDHKMNWVDIEDSLRLICRIYYSDKQYDQAISISDIKRSLKPIERSLSTSNKLIKSASPESLSAIYVALRKKKPHHSAISKNYIDDLMETNDVVMSAIQQINAIKAKKVKKRCVENACARAIVLCEQITRRKFTYTYALAQLRHSERSARVESEFEHADPEFVHAVMRGIDPSISISRVRTGLRDASKQRRTLSAEKIAKIAS
jgi:uncharacterized protein YdaT